MRDPVRNPVYKTTPEHTNVWLVEFYHPVPGSVMPGGLGARGELAGILFSANDTLPMVVAELPEAVDVKWLMEPGAIGHAGRKVLDDIAEANGSAVPLGKLLTGKEAKVVKAMLDEWPTLWWHSFVSGETGRFMNVALVRGVTQTASLRAARKAGANPTGTSVMSQSFPPGIAEIVPQSYLNRPLSKDEAEELSRIIDDALAVRH